MKVERVVRRWAFLWPDGEIEVQHSTATKKQLRFGLEVFSRNVRPRIVRVKVIVLA